MYASTRATPLRAHCLHTGATIDACANRPQNPVRSSDLQSPTSKPKHRGTPTHPSICVILLPKMDPHRVVTQ